MDEQRVSGERMDAGDELDRRTIEALARVPAVLIPPDFAARVTRQMPERRFAVAASTPGRYGLMAARIGMAVLLLAIGVVAMRAADRGVIGVALEWVLCAQLAGLAVWMGDAKTLLKG